MNKALRKELGWLALGTGVAAWALGKRRVAGSLGLLAAGLAVLGQRAYDYRGRSVVITGGSRGLGLAIARRLALIGADVTLLARDADELQRAKVSLAGLNDRVVHTVVADVTDNQQIVEAIENITAHFGGIDVWINNAGAISVGPFESMDERDFEAQLNLHLRAVIGITQLLVPYFRERGGGRVINVSSIGGLLGVPHLSAYCASKHALAGFTSAIAPELARENIICTTAFPSLMRTGSPIQAVFKGDHQAEYAWFAASDNLPGLSISAASAARTILSAHADGRTEVVVGVAAKAGRALRTVLPEVYAMSVRSVARVLPNEQSHVRRTGADIRALGASVEPLRWLAEKVEADLNQRAKKNSEFNLGRS